MKIISQCYKEVTRKDVNSTPEDMHEQKVKKAAIVILVSLTSETENKSSEELKSEIRNALKECLLKIPWIALENVIIVKE